MATLAYLTLDSVRNQLRIALGDDARAAIGLGTMKELAAAGRLARVFHTRPSGHSGSGRFLKRSELRHGLHELRVRASPPVVDEIFRTLDNGTGRISFLDLNRWLARRGTEDDDADAAKIREQEKEEEEASSEDEEIVDDDSNANDDSGDDDDEDGDFHVRSRSLGSSPRPLLSCLC